MQGREKGHRVLDQEDRVDVLKHRPPVLSERVSLVRPCDLRRFHITNKNTEVHFGRHFWLNLTSFLTTFFLLNIAFIALPVGLVLLVL